MPNSLSLNQRSKLGEIIHKLIPELDSELVWRLTGEITDKQYNFLWAVRFKEPEKLKQVVPEMLKFYQLTN